MRASVFVGTSLDGFIARTNGGLDFLPPGGGEPHGYDEFIATVDALVIGRKTYETAMAFDTWPYGEKPVFVLSTRALATPPPGAVVERMWGEPIEIVSRLEARGIRHAYVDGGITIQQFLQAGLIQRLIITRVPVLIGEGIPLFGALQRDIAFKHVQTRQYPSGLVQSEYVVTSNKRQLPKPSYMYAWEYEVRPDKLPEFLAAYGPKGSWVELFQGSPGYIQTELHRDRGNPNRYLTLDYWESVEAWDDFRRSHSREFEALDGRCEAFVLRESEIGRFVRI